MFTEIVSLFRRRTTPPLSTEVYRRHLLENPPGQNDHETLTQDWVCRLTRADVQINLERLEPEVPWCHFFKLADDIYTVAPNQPKHFGKAKALKLLADHLRHSIPYIVKKTDFRDVDVLDLACAEGAHSIELANAGARKVVGIEGRQGYVDRARFIANCAGLNNVTFEQGDVRSISRERTGSYDLVLFFGILHHLSEQDYLPMLKRLHEVTGDTLVLYTHTSEPGWEVKFKLGEEFVNSDSLRGRLYREHPDGASPALKATRNRNSLDNTFSFWARESSLLEAIRRAGFSYISKQLHPNGFENPAEEFRVLYICRK